MEQWADSITAVLDDLGSSEAVLLANVGALPPAALFAATHPSRTTALVVLEGYADAKVERPDELKQEMIATAVGMYTAAAPFHRVIGHPTTTVDDIAALALAHGRINPAAVQRRIQSLTNQLLTLTTSKPEPVSTNAHPQMGNEKPYARILT